MTIRSSRTGHPDAASVRLGFALVFTDGILLEAGELPTRQRVVRQSRGSRTVNVVPASSLDSTSMRPPCALTMRSAM